MFNLEALDPRSKIIMIASISTGAMAISNIWFLSGLLAFTILIMLIGGIGATSQIKQGRVAFGMVVFLFIIQAIFGRWLIGAMLCVRLLIVIMSALILLTGQTRDYLLALTQWKLPAEIAYMVMMGLHFFPIIKEEAMDIYYSIQLRGIEVKKTSLAKKLKVYRKISLPILAGAMSRAKDTSISMEARAFRAYPKRTYMRKLKLSKKDAFSMILFPVLCAAFIFAGCTLENSMPALQAISPKEVPSQIVLSCDGNGETTEIVSWKGTEKYKSYIRYGTKKNYKSTGDFSLSKEAKVVTVREGKYYRYSVKLVDLEKNTQYYYSVGAGEKWSKRAAFTTAGNEKQFQFMSLGDVQYNLRERDYGIWGDNLESAYKRNPKIKLTLMMGDMVEKNGDIEDWNYLLDETQNVFTSVPVMTTAGNHETSIIPKTYLQVMSLPENGPKDLKEEVYSFDYGNCHFVALNSCLFMDERKNSMSEKEWKNMMESVDKWLDKDLKESKAKWTIVFMHHPAYPIAEDDHKIYKAIRENWVPIFEKEKVDLVLCGHQHVYMRTKKIKGVTYMMADSGQKASHYYYNGMKMPSYVKKFSDVESTYEIYNVKEKSFLVKAYDSAGNIIDSFSLEK